MRIKKGFRLRKICREKVVVAEGLENINFNKMLALNDSAALLWEAAVGRDFTPEELADVLVREYEIDRQMALDDTEALLQSWKESGVIED